MTPPHDFLALDVAVPVYNEQADLDRSIRTLHAYLADEFDFAWRITIADNASTDDTADIADSLAAEFAEVVAVHMAEKGRGRALKRVWLDSPAQVLAYVDVDLSTDLSALPPLIAPLLSGHSDLAIGTRLASSSRVVRGAKREFISRSYNFLLRRAMSVEFSDAQCGFKAIRREVAQQLLPTVEDTGWFFDTEMLIIAERAGMRIHEVPVDWVDDPRSSVDVAKTAREDLKGMVRVTRNLMNGTIPVGALYDELGRRPFAQATAPSFFGQVVRFGAIGIMSTAAYALLYLVFQLVVPAQASNFLALLVTAIANTWANRRFTFGVRGRDAALKHQLQGLVVFALAWVITSGSLVLLEAVRPEFSAHAQLLVLMAANLIATVLRFVLLRVWVFRRQRHPAASDLAASPAPTMSESPASAVGTESSIVLTAPSKVTES
ncbi:bifunctional glycosyltransferase family 2/GtrA family protein [Glaciihabitans sp. dw_435]|uniref:bifunctional glycosyltransferase family 2/GtrA family protein n=1 Tax=Glaciihabitans sp. dw_435 TaxID=2720081 RepID=UPI001BD61C57|nr:bifunctional glycosyltransferase family 2/GtrA family protein [Glaciihabitans sp. dw_435]